MGDMDEYLPTLEGQIRCTVNGGFHGPDGDNGSQNGDNSEGTESSWTFYLIIGVLVVTAVLFVALGAVAWKYRHALMEDGRPGQQETMEDLDDDLENGEEELSVIDTLDDFNDNE